MAETATYLDKKDKEWRVDIESFEGPLDLLLHLIRKHNLDIYDIPIARITTEYLKYVDKIKKFDLNLNNVGDFMVMASILMRIKAKTLLPQPQESDEEEDPREMKRRLVERLVEYKKFKESIEFFEDREKHNENIISLNQYPLKEFGRTVDATLFDLIDVFRELIENASDEVKDIITEEFTVDEKIRFIMDKVEKKASFTLSEIVEPNSSKMELIVTLLAILELVRTHQISIQQKSKFTDIYVEEYN
ncbi:MAG: segregation and condensation protein A [Elusimicrobiota bacterium]